MTVPTPYKGNESYIFVSYAHKDAAAVWEIVEKLQAAGFRVWFGQGVDSGSEWAGFIADRVMNCGYFIAFLSADYIASENCRNELSFAREQGKRQLLVYLEEVELPDGMAMRLNRLQAIFKPRYEDEARFYERLFAAANTDPAVKDSRMAAERGNASAQGEPARSVPRGECVCLTCGSSLPAGLPFCTVCGAALRDARSARPPAAPMPAYTSPPPSAIPSATQAARRRRFFPGFGGRRSRAQPSFAAPENTPPRISQVEFSVVAPKNLTRGERAVVDVVMYEAAFRSVVEELRLQAEAPTQEKRSGLMDVEENAEVKVVLESPDLWIEENEAGGVWRTGHLDFSFPVLIPADYEKKQVAFTARVYVNGVIATRLSFVCACTSLFRRKLRVERDDVLTAFVSYASADRQRVAAVVQGMQKARPDLDVFLDVESLRSGDRWEDALYREIDGRDVLFLCWSHNARASEWVDREWRRAFSLKGPDGIEPVPIEKPDECPPPEELRQKHWNDILLYLM